MKTKTEMEKAEETEVTVKPCETEASGIAAAAAQIRAAAKSDPQAYLDQTVSPGGGE